jgi:hypothetical protein
MWCCCPECDTKFHTSDPATRTQALSCPDCVAWHDEKDAYLRLSDVSTAPESGDYVSYEGETFFQIWPCGAGLTDLSCQDHVRIGSREDVIRHRKREGIWAPTWVIDRHGKAHRILI